MSDREKFDLLAEGLALNYAAANSLPTYPHDLAKNIADAIEKAVAEKHAQIDRLKEACSKEHESVQKLDSENQRLKAELYRVTSDRSDWIACAECYRNERDTIQRDIDALRALVSGE